MYLKNTKYIKLGCKKDNIKFNFLRFADDLALLANNIEETKPQRKSLQETAKKVGLRILIEKKTEIMMTQPPIAKKYI